MTYINPLGSEHCSLRPVLEADGGAVHSGCIVAWYPDAATQKALALPGGEDADEIHVTIVYVGQAKALSEEQRRRLGDIVAGVAASHKPLRGRVGGWGRFTGNPAGEDVYYAAIDVPGLAELRTALVKALEGAGFDLPDDHGYSPHATLAYIPSAAPTPRRKPRNLDLALDALTLCLGGERTPYDLTGKR